MRTKLLNKLQTIINKKNSRTKKGFTLVELLVVIAILAVLATVSVVGYMSFVRDAEVSNDTALIKQLNTVLMAEEVMLDKNVTMGDAIADAERRGFSVEKLTPRSDNDIVWDEVNNRFALMSPDKTVLAGEESVKDTDISKLWKIVRNSDEVKLNDYSYYLADNFRMLHYKTVLEYNTSIDTGNTNIDLKYVSSTNKDVVVKTNDATISLTIADTSESSKIEHYGNVGKVTIEDTGYDCYYEYGTAAYTAVTEGKVVVGKGGAMEVVYATADRVAVQTVDGGQVGALYCAGNAQDYTTFSAAHAGNVPFESKTVEEIETLGDEVLNNANAKVIVEGIAGFENVEFETMNDAYMAIRAKVDDLAGLEQATASKEDFDAFFVNGGKVTWKIYGKHSVTDPYMLSFGRHAAYYGYDLWFNDFEVVGMNKFAEVVFDNNITLPRNWWTYAGGDLTLTFDSVRLTEKSGNQILFGQAYAYAITVNIVDSTVNGNIYMYHNDELNMNIKNTTFNGVDESYALMVQGDHPGRIVIDGCTFKDYSRGVNFQRSRTNFVLTNSLFETNRAASDRGVVQITDGASFVINNNVIKANRGNAFWFHSAATNAEATYEIKNNTIQAGYLANNDANFDVNDKITSSGNTFGTTDTKHCMEAGATEATDSTVTAIK